MIGCQLPKLAFATLLVVASGRAMAAEVSPPGAAADTVARADTATASAHPARVFTRLDTIVTLPEIRVERARARPESAHRAPTGWIVSIPARASGRALETLPELILAAPGAHVTQYGGLGAFSVVSLRGAPANQVAVFLDGMPLAGAGRAVVDLSTVPLAAVERADVYLGGSPLSLGAAPGGAVDLITRRDARGLELRGSGGSFGTWEGAATTGGSRGTLHALLHVSGQGSRGDFPYLDDNGTPFNAADDSVHGRINAQFRSLGAMAGLEWTPPSPWRARVREHLFRRVQGVPGLGAIPADDTRLGFTRSLTQLALSHAAGGRWLPFAEASGWLGGEWTRFEDAQSQLGLGRHDTHDRLGDAGTRLRASWPALPLGFLLETGTEARRERAQLADALRGRPDPPASSREALAAMTAVGWRGLGERLELRAARRWDRLWDRLHANDATGATTSEVTRTLDAPQLGARARLGLGFEARANWSRAGRAPDFTELFGDAGSVLGNPALTPETDENRDAGLAWDGPGLGPVRARLSWTAFDSRLADLILYVRNSQSSVRAQNISRARIRGHEALVRVSGTNGLSASVAFTTERAIDEGPVSFWHGKRLPEHPDQEGDLMLDWSRRVWGAGASLAWLGDEYLDRYNRYRVAARRLWGAHLRAPLVTPALALTLEGKNLGDDRASDVAGFPLPGRSFFVALETRLGPAPAPTP